MHQDKEQSSQLHLIKEPLLQCLVDGILVNVTPPPPHLPPPPHTHTHLAKHACSVAGHLTVGFAKLDHLQYFQKEYIITIFPFVIVTTS